MVIIPGARYLRVPYPRNSNKYCSLPQAESGEEKGKQHVYAYLFIFAENGQNSKVLKCPEMQLTGGAEGLHHLRSEAQSKALWNVRSRPCRRPACEAQLRTKQCKDLQRWV